MVDFGKRIKALRKAKHLTQDQIAARISVTKAMVSAYETGIRYPSYDIMIKLSRIFGVSVDYLLGIDNREYLDISGLTESQKEIIYNLIAEFKNTDKN